MVHLFVQFSTDDIVRHQLLFHRPIPGFEPSPASYALAVEFFEFSRARLVAAGVTDPEDFDVFTALVAGLADQQVANDPGGDRWVRHSRSGRRHVLCRHRSAPRAARKATTRAKRNHEQERGESS